jgi:hypothetical protein
VSAVKIVTAPITTPVSDLASEPHPPKPYDTVQGMEHVISMMEDTFQICEREQHSTQMAPCYETFPFVLRPPSDIYTRQAIKSSKIQSERRTPSSDLKLELRQAAVRSMYRSSNIRVHNTPYVATALGRRSTDSSSLVPRELPRL